MFTDSSGLRYVRYCTHISRNVLVLQITASSFNVYVGKRERAEQSRKKEESNEKYSIKYRNLFYPPFSKAFMLKYFESEKY